VRMDIAGRDPELALLDQAIDSVLSGATQVVLCCGEAGIGKTRLAEEARARAAERGIESVWGAAVQDTGAPPLWLWRQIVRDLREHCDIASLAREVDGTGELYWLTQELRAPAPPLSSLEPEA
jgi:predicted ATPase